LYILERQQKMDMKHFHLPQEPLIARLKHDSGKSEWQEVD
jgi:hypothetical protein